MSRFELNIYGENDEIIKKYETNYVRWGTILQAIDLQEKIKNNPMTEQIEMINSFVQSLFKGLTSDELKNADSMDVMNTFKQLISSVGGIDGGNAKNA